MSRYFRFGLRTILIVTTIAAVIFAWLSCDILRAQREKPVIDAIVGTGGRIRFDGDTLPAMHNFSSRNENPTFLQRQFGHHYGAYVEEVSLLTGMGNPTDETIQGLSQFERLRVVALRGRGFTDKSVDELERLRQLESLELMFTSVSPAGVKRLAKCSKLEQLVFCDDSSDRYSDKKPILGNAHLEPLSEFPALWRLVILGEALTDEAFAHVGKCTELTELVIGVHNSAGVTDKAFEHLANLQQLQTLEILEIAPTDKSMQQIGKLRRLKTLRLYSTSITDQGLAELHGLTDLEELELDPCMIDGSGFAALSSLKSLHVLSVGSTVLSDEGLAAIASLPGLTELNFDETKVTGEGLVQLARATKLRRLSIHLTDELTLDDAKALKAKLPNCQIFYSSLDLTIDPFNFGAL